MQLYHDNGPCPHPDCDGTLTVERCKELDTQCGLAGFFNKRITTCSKCGWRLVENLGEWEDE